MTEFWIDPQTAGSHIAHYTLESKVAVDRPGNQFCFSAKFPSLKSRGQSCIPQFNPKKNPINHPQKTRNISTQIEAPLMNFKGQIGWKYDRMNLRILQVTDPANAEDEEG